MAFCSECGAKLVEGAGFCSNCGTKVPPLSTGTVTAAQPVQATTQQQASARTQQQMQDQARQQAKLQEKLRSQQQAGAQARQRAAQPVQMADTAKEVVTEVKEWITNMVQASDAPGEVVLSAWSNGRTVDPAAIVSMLAGKAVSQAKAAAAQRPATQKPPRPAAAPAPVEQPRPAATPAPVEPPKPAAAQHKASGKKFCRICGKPVTAGAKFCKNCGTKINT